MSRYSVIRLLETFFRRWWLYLLPLVLLCGLGAATLATKKHVYKSVGTVEVQSNTILGKLAGVDPGYGYDTPAVATAKQITSRLQTQVFIEDVAKRAGLTDLVTGGVLTYDKLRSSIGAFESGTNLLKVVVNFEDPTVSQRLAQSTIDAFVQSVIDANVGDYVVAVSFLDDQLKTYQDDVDTARNALDDYLLAHPTPSGFGAERPDAETIQIQRLQANVSQTEERYNTAVSKREDARLSAEQTKADVGRRIRTVDAPELPVVPEGGLKTAIVGFAVFAVMGVLLSVAAVVIATTFDHSIRFPSDMKDRLGLAVLAVVPESKAIRAAGRASSRGRSAAAPAEPERARLAPRVNTARTIPVAPKGGRERLVEREAVPARRPAERPAAPPAPAPRREQPVEAARKPRPAGPPPDGVPAPRPAAEAPPVRREPEVLPAPPAAPAPAPVQAPVQAPAATAPAAAVDRDENGRAWPPGRRPSSPSENGNGNGNGSGWPPSRRGGGRSGNIPHAS